jgi:hypothetical protein
MINKLMGSKKPRAAVSLLLACSMLMSTFMVNGEWVLAFDGQHTATIVNEDEHGRLEFITEGVDDGTGDTTSEDDADVTYESDDYDVYSEDDSGYVDIDSDDAGIQILGSSDEIEIADDTSDEDVEVAEEFTDEADLVIGTEADTDEDTDIPEEVSDESDVNAKADVDSETADSDSDVNVDVDGDVSEVDEVADETDDEIVAYVSDEDTETTVVVTDDSEIISDETITDEEENYEDETIVTDDEAVLETEEDNSEISRTFTKGSTILVKAVPDDGWYLNTVKIVTSNGKSVSYTITNGDTISFVMPNKDITIKATFSDTLSIINTDADAVDATTYIRSNLNSDYVNFSKWEEVNAIVVKQTVAARDVFEKAGRDVTIDEMFPTDGERDNLYDALINFQTTAVLVIDVDENSDYYVAYVDTMHDDADVELSDYVFTQNNTDGIVVDGCILDESTGIAYIPKSLMDVVPDDADSTDERLAPIQVQLLNTYETDTDDLTTDINIVVNNDDETVISGVASLGIYDDGVSVKIAETSEDIEDIANSDITVNVNGVAISSDNYEYDEETGVLSVTCEPTMMESISVDVNEKNTVSNIVDTVAGEYVASATTGNLIVYGQYGVSWSGTGYTVDSLPKVNANSWYVTSGTPKKGQTWYGYLPITYLGKTASRADVSTWPSGDKQAYVNGNNTLGPNIKNGAMSNVLVAQVPTPSVWYPFKISVAKNKKISFSSENNGSSTINISNGSAESLRLQCGHTNTGLNTTTNTTQNCYIRILHVTQATSSSKGTITFGVVTGLNSANQAGAGVFKVQWEQDEKYITVKKSISSSYTGLYKQFSAPSGTSDAKAALYPYHIGGTQYKLYKSDGTTWIATFTMAYNAGSTSATVAKVSAASGYNTKDGAVQVPNGSYVIKEYSNSGGLNVATGKDTISINNSSKEVTTYTGKVANNEKPITFSMTMSKNKASGSPTATNYSIKGTKFQVYCVTYNKQYSDLAETASQISFATKSSGLYRADTSQGLYLGEFTAEADGSCKVTATNSKSDTGWASTATNNKKTLSNLPVNAWYFVCESAIGSNYKLNQAIVVFHVTAKGECDAYYYIKGADVGGTLKFSDGYTKGKKFGSEFLKIHSRNYSNIDGESATVSFTKDNNAHSVSITYTNSPVYGYLSIYKFYSEKGKTINATDQTPLGGVKFYVFRTESQAKKYSTTGWTSGEAPGSDYTYDTIVSNDDGYAYYWKEGTSVSKDKASVPAVSSRKLAIGSKYYLVEAPESQQKGLKRGGVSIDASLITFRSKVQTVTVTEHGSETVGSATNTSNLNIYNGNKTDASVAIHKVVKPDADEKNTCSLYYVEGIKFALFTNSSDASKFLSSGATTTPTTSTYSSYIGTKKTNEYGDAIWSGLSLTKSYYIVEYAASAQGNVTRYYPPSDSTTTPTKKDSVKFSDYYTVPKAVYSIASKNLESEEVTYYCATKKDYIPQGESKATATSVVNPSIQKYGDLYLKKVTNIIDPDTNKPQVLSGVKFYIIPATKLETTNYAYVFENYCNEFGDEAFTTMDTGLGFLFNYFTSSYSTFLSDYIYTTDANGEIHVSTTPSSKNYDLEAGETYYIIEVPNQSIAVYSSFIDFGDKTTSPAGMQRVTVVANTPQYIEYTAGMSGSTFSNDYVNPPKVQVLISKSMDTTNCTDALNNPLYSYAGIKYGVYTDEDCTDESLYTTITLSDSKNTTTGLITASSSTEYLAWGQKYYIREIADENGMANDYFKWSEHISTIDLTSDYGTCSSNVKKSTNKASNGSNYLYYYKFVVSEKDEPLTDPLSVIINKTDNEGNVLKDVGDDYSLAGTKFRINYYKGYYHSVAEIKGRHLTPDATVDISTTYDEYSNAYTAELNRKFGLGTITVQEIEAASNYEITGQLYVVGQAKIDTSTIAIADDDDSDNAGEYESVETLCSDNIFVGQIVVDKTSENGVSIQSLEGEDASVLYAYNELTLDAANDVVRGDISVKKTDFNNKPMEGVVFAVSLLSEENGDVVETHMFTTDSTGSFNSNTAGSDFWFYGTSDEDLQDASTVDTDKGRLPAGYYVIEEIASGNNNTQLCDPQYFEIKKDDTSDDIPVVSLTMEDPPFPEITTVEKDNTTGTHFTYNNGTAIIVDNVQIKYLHFGGDNDVYTVLGVLVDITDKNNPVLVTDSSGDLVSAKVDIDLTKLETEVDQYHYTYSGDVKYTFDYDTTKMKGHTFVVYEFLANDTQSALTNDDITINTSGSITFTNDELLLGLMYDYNGDMIMHASMDDVNQTGYIPYASTSAVNTATNNRMANKSSSVTIKDTVTCIGLKTNEQYTVKGYLVDTDGNKVASTTSSVPFTATSSEMNVDVTFTLDASKYSKDSIVVYEELYYVDSSNNNKETLIAEHKDTTDTNQTIIFPEVETTATSSETNQHISMAGSNITINDKVAVKNVISGGSYVLYGELHYSDGSAVTINGKTVSNTVTFTANEAIYDSTAKCYYVTVPFTFDASSLAGKTVVVYETLYSGSVSTNNKLASHEDKTDKGQSINFPSVGTTAQDKTSSTKLVYTQKSATISDTIAYTNLDTSLKYYFVTKVLDTTSNEFVATVTGKYFQPSSENGSTTVDITNVDTSSLKGHTLVVFEYLYLYPTSGTANPETDIKVAVHEDKTDVGQTVYVPSASTKISAAKAVDGDTTTDGMLSVMADGVRDFNDTVTMTNFVSGDFTIKGYLVDKSTEKIVATSYKTFSATSANAEVTMTFSGINTDNYIEKTLVAYEYIYAGTIKDANLYNPTDTFSDSALKANSNSSKLICDHADKNDANQSFSVAGVPVYFVKTVPTGDKPAGATLRVVNITENKVVDEWTTTKNEAHKLILKPGKYQFIETAAPAGYTIADPINFTIEGSKAKYTDSGEELAKTLIDSKNCYTITMEDVYAAQLPTAGGVGTTGFVTFGCSMATLGAVLYIKRRKHA